MSRPDVRCVIRGVKANYVPGDLLMPSYTLDMVEGCELNAIETSVIWLTTGKGQQDIGVHFFERRQKAELDQIDRTVPQKLTVRLPNTPLSYPGKILQVGWCLRIRVFLSDGRQFTFDDPFQLGSIDQFDEADS